ncbi:MAG: hypothetical protein AABW81_03820 [Nanoarchaeota archaeon]
MAEIKTVAEIIKEVSPYYKDKDPEAEHSLAYESSSETLEPVYFFILDLMNEFGLDPKKFVDNFVSSPGSGHFSELQGKATIMQQQGTKILADVNVVLRSVLNIIYDLKDFRIRLQAYDDFKSKDKNKSEAARLSLKQIWLDKVDINKGNSSIKAMALGQAGFQTLLDAFLIAKDEKDAGNLDLNDRVKRIVQQRVQEFNIWLSQSESELRKRYEIEKSYLKGQVNSLKLYSRWAKPYLRAAQQLEMKEGGREPALVKTFNTLILELSLFGKSKLKVEDAAAGGDLPADFRKMKIKRDYYSCILVDFKFRGIPQKAGQHYVFGGRAEISFKAYALNSDEISKLEKELDKSDVGDVLNLIKGTTDSLEQLQEDINFFLEEKTKEEKEKEKAKDSSNPFMALFGKYDNPGKKDEKKDENKNKKDDDKPVKSDDWVEKTHFRPAVAEKAKDTAFSLFDIYKKAHGMPSYA